MKTLFLLVAKFGGGDAIGQAETRNEAGQLVEVSPLSIIGARCLAALRVRARAPDSVVVVLRDGDADSRALVNEVCSSWNALHPVVVNRPGVVAAMNAGLVAVSGDVLALTDDDAEPAPDWLERLVAVFEGLVVGSRQTWLGQGNQSDGQRLCEVGQDRDLCR